MGRRSGLALPLLLPSIRARVGHAAADEARIWADLRAQFEASANGTRFLHEQERRLQATPAPSVSVKNEHCKNCWWRKSPPAEDHWWAARTTTQRNGLGEYGGRPYERMSCPVGWGQVNKDNIRLKVEKKWERVCFYCWRAKLKSATDMERLIAHTTWDEQQYYSLFYIYGCGGMFGTPRYNPPGGCTKKLIEHPLEVDSKGHRVTANEEGVHEVLIGLAQNQRPPLGFECCARQGGWDMCSSARGLGPAAFSLVAVGLAFFVG